MCWVIGLVVFSVAIHDVHLLRSLLPFNVLLQLLVLPMRGQRCRCRHSSGPRTWHRLLRNALESVRLYMHGTLLSVSRRLFRLVGWHLVERVSELSLRRSWKRRRERRGSCGGHEHVVDVEFQHESLHVHGYFNEYASGRRWATSASSTKLASTTMKGRGGRWNQMKPRDLSNETKERERNQK